MRMIQKGHHLLPWFSLPSRTKKIDFTYYEGPLKEAAALNLPISFVSTQWERILSDELEFSSLPADQNPNVVSLNGKILSKVSPFGPVSLWRTAGRHWTSSPLIKRLVELYPDPPLVLFVSNNEHRKLRWHEVTKSLRYRAMYGMGRDDEFKRQVVGDAWVQRYRALQEGMRDGLERPSWKEGSIFIGYGAFGGSAFARGGGWKKYSLHVPGRIDPLGASAG